MAGSNPAVVTWMLWVVHLNKAIYVNCLRPNLRNNKENVLQIQKKIYSIIHIYVSISCNKLITVLAKKIYKEYKMCLMDIMIISSTWSHSDRVIPHFDMAPDLFTLYGRHHLQSSVVGVKQVGMLEACSIVCIFHGKPKNHKSHLLKTQVKDMFPLYTNIKIRFSKMISC